MIDDRRNLTGAVLCAFGLGAIFAARVGHIVLRPEWTEAQALLHLWPFWSGGVAAILGGLWLLRRTEGGTPS